MPTPTQTWAAAHANTVTTEPNPLDSPSPSEPVPVRLTSLTEVNSWPVASGEIRVVWAKQGEQLLLATGSSDNNVRIRDAATGQVLHTLSGHTGPVYSVAWISTPAGQLLLASGSADNTARIWDGTSGEWLHTLTGHTDDINAVAWTTTSAGGLVLATGSEDNTARIWDGSTGQPVRTLAGHTDLIWSMAWAPADNHPLLLATSSNDATVRIWDAATGQTLQTLSGHSQQVNSVAWIVDAEGQLLLATGGDDHTARIWNASGSELGVLQHPETSVGGNRVYQVSWAPLRDGRLLLATTSSRALRLWDGLTNTQVYEQELGFSGAGLKHLDWVITDDGRLLLITISLDAGTTARIWEVILDPPVLPQAQVWQPDEREAIVLEGIEEVTPNYPDAERIRQRTDSVGCSVQPDGAVLMATTGYDTAVHVWNLTTGQLLNSVDAPQTGQSVAWDPDGSRLAVGSGDDTARIWDPFTGNLLKTLTGHSGAVGPVVWGKTSDGRLLLATGSEDGSSRIWDPETGNTVHVLADVDDGDEFVAWAERSPLLATSGYPNGVRIWDANDGRLVDTLSEDPYVGPLAWTRTPGEQLLLATGSEDDGSVRIWEPETGNTPRVVRAGGKPVQSLAWGTTRDDQLLLAIGDVVGAAQIWDPFRAVQLWSVASTSDMPGAIEWVLSPDGDLLLVVANYRADPGPAKVWRVRVKPVLRTRSVGSRSANSERRVGRVLALGSAGMWRPMGLVEDLVQVTGKDAGTEATLNDGRLGALANEPGIRRLRELGWSANARLAFVPLLTSRLSPQEPFEPPAEESPAALRSALRSALASHGGAARPAGIEVAELHAAAQEITDRIITLLTILGPRACAVDPLLPTRLLHRITQLPALNGRQLRLMSSGELEREVLERARGTGNHEYNPGTAGLARSGPLNRLLPTQLALPHDLMTMRYLENHLLYRQHRAPVPPTPEVVTLVLDTSPPTYGLVEQVLRLAAHLLVVTLWEHGHQPGVVTLDEPEAVVTLTRRVDLMRMWTSRTLKEPWPAIKTAVHAASGTGRPVLLLTHHHTSHGGYHASDRTRLLTAHHPPESPPDGRMHAYHRHLSPNPSRDELAEAITGLLVQSRDRV